MTISIELSGIHHEYQQNDGKTIPVLNDLSISIEYREFVAVVGPSGCGKSTLLKLLSGLLIPTTGRVSIFGLDVVGPRNDVGIVFQKPTLLPWLTVRDNVLFPITHTQGKPNSEDYSRADELLAMIGLSSFAHQYPAALSGGMQQRVGIARALILDPDILIMDEPFSALDALTREQLGFDLLKWWQASPKTVLFITHSISEAVLLADKVLVMSQRPARLLDSIQVDLARPRSLDTLRDPAFSGYTLQLRQYLYAPAEHAAIGGQDVA